MLIVEIWDQNPVPAVHNQTQCLWSQSLVRLSHLVEVRWYLITVWRYSSVNEYSEMFFQCFFVGIPRDCSQALLDMDGWILETGVVSIDLHQLPTSCRDGICIYSVHPLTFVYLWISFPTSVSISKSIESTYTLHKSYILFLLFFGVYIFHFLLPELS